MDTMSHAIGAAWARGRTRCVAFWGGCLVVVWLVFVGFWGGSWVVLDGFGGGFGVVHGWFWMVFGWFWVVVG